MYVFNLTWIFKDKYFCHCWMCNCALFQVHGLDAETWKKVDVVYIDIADRSQVEPKVNMFTLRPMFIHAIRVTSFTLFILGFCVSLQDYKPEEDPCRYKSVKTGRGPLGPDWKVQSFLMLLMSQLVKNALKATEMHNEKWYASAEDTEVLYF